MQYRILTLLITIGMFFGCMPDKLDKWDVDKGSSSGSSSGSTSGSTLATTSSAQMIVADATSETEGMSLAISHKLHSEGTVSGACEIQNVGIAGAPVQQLCWLDAEELDLYMWGMDLKLYVEKDACDYVGYNGFTFYNDQPGRTEVNSTHDLHVVDVDNGCSIPAGATDRVPSCYFNRSGKNGGPDCDAGKIEYIAGTVSIEEVEDGMGGITRMCVTEYDTELTEIDCSGGAGYGAYYNCLEGPGKDSGTGVAGSITYANGDVHGYSGPKEDVWEPTGSDKLFEYNHPIDLKFAASNIYLANYMRFCRSGSNSLKYNVEGKISYSTFQTALNNPTVPNDYIAEQGAGPRSDYTNPFYEWTCYDKAGDVKSKIRVVVRDWNTKFDPAADYMKLAYPDEGAAAGQEIMDREGTEYTNAGVWHDLTDWDDYSTSTTLMSTSICTGARPASTYYRNYPKAKAVGAL